MINLDYKSFNCYTILDIPSDSSPQEIKKAYFQKSLKTHPDRGGSHELQIKVNTAFEVLSDPIVREEHDRYWKNISFSWGNKESSVKTSQVNNQTSNSFDKLYQRVSDIYSNKINTIIMNYSKWVNDKILLYTQLYRDWNKKILKEYELNLEKYFKLISDKLDNRKYFNWGTIIITLLTIIGSIPLLSINISLTQISLFLIWTICSIVWLLFINNKMIVIYNRIFTIGDDTKEKIKQFLNEQLSLNYIKLGETYIYINDNDWEKIIQGAVQKEWGNYLQKEKNSILSTKNYYISIVSQICDIAGKNITFDSSEEQTARRIATTFFFMGYTPKLYIDNARMFIMSDGAENIVIRFRHRRGEPTNISYVRRMAEIMAEMNAYKGFLFCTPGLSENAKDFSRHKNITWYSLEDMNSWINNVNKYGYDGPKGDIQKHLENVIKFLRNISIALPRQ